jgi:hypothetical protein
MHDPNFLQLSSLPSARLRVSSHPVRLCQLLEEVQALCRLPLLVRRAINDEAEAGRLTRGEDCGRRQQLMLAKSQL